jgi:hypothetical protein
LLSAVAAGSTLKLCRWEPSSPPLILLKKPSLLSCVGLGLGLGLPLLLKLPLLKLLLGGCTGMAPVTDG